MSGRGQYDDAFRPVIIGTVVIVIVGWLWQFWYIGLPVLILVAGWLFWVWQRNVHGRTERGDESAHGRP